ncbi:spore coat protein [Shimazuella sp. KC615]|uniref:Spore coat protein n=2 Tax=Shimazuella alba TaxID=2690964 RepID=A0A6I4VSH0_9BACL|nr:spore coat protein [Shimazuella alba]
MGMLENMSDMVTNSGMMNDGIIATGFLNDCKVGIRNYAVAISETANQELRDVLRRQLDDAIEMHAKVFEYMESKGLYNAKDFQQQIKIDMRNLETATNIMQ